MSTDKKASKVTTTEPDSVQATNPAPDTGVDPVSGDSVSPFVAPPTVPVSDRSVNIMIPDSIMDSLPEVMTRDNTTMIGKTAKGILRFLANIGCSKASITLVDTLLQYVGDVKLDRLARIIRRDDYYIAWVADGFAADFIMNGFDSLYLAKARMAAQVQVSGPNHKQNEELRELVMTALAVVTTDSPVSDAATPDTSTTLHSLQCISTSAIPENVDINNPDIRDLLAMVDADIDIVDMLTEDYTGTEVLNRAMQYLQELEKAQS